MAHSLFSRSLRSSSHTVKSKMRPMPPAFLAPCLSITRLPVYNPTADFSSSALRHARSPNHPIQREKLRLRARKPGEEKRRDKNRLRGVSAMRRTGLRRPLTVSKYPLPQPVLDPALRIQPEVDPDHGLWSFFRTKEKPYSTPEEDDSCGRPWKVQDLQYKSWEDLHRLWWVCAKERNRIATESYERKRVRAGYGEHESHRRKLVVKNTQKAIKHVLLERFYSWESAWQELEPSEKQPAEPKPALES